MDDARHHRVLLVGEVSIVLVHRETGPPARRLLQYLGVVQLDVGADQIGHRIGEAIVQQQARKLSRLGLHVLGKEHLGLLRVLVFPFAGPSDVQGGPLLDPAPDQVVEGPFQPVQLLTSEYSADQHIAIILILFDLFFTKHRFNSFGQPELLGRAIWSIDCNGTRRHAKPQDRGVKTNGLLKIGVGRERDYALDSTRRQQTVAGADLRSHDQR